MLAQTAARADGGAGGAADAGYNSGAGGAGGTGSAGNSGSAGGNDTFYGGGGGGGGGAGGGTGGQGGAGQAGTNAAGGTAGSPDGAAGADYNGPAPGSGGGGGGGGYGGLHGNGAGAASIANTGTLSGGPGGNGGNGGAGNGTGGGGGGAGGAGGYGAVVTGAGSSSNSGGGSISGGSGGNGGNGGSSRSYGGMGGAGGDGGIGVALTASGGSFTNSSAVSGGDGGNGGAGGLSTVSGGGNGGNGGAGGAGITAAGVTIDNSGTIDGGAGGSGGAAGNASYYTPVAGTDGAGGAGIVGSDLTIVNSGTISGGLGGDGTTRANAITFTGGDNKITFGNSTSGLTGNVDVTGTLTFDQSANDVTVGNTITGSGSVAKTGTATVTLSGTNTYSGGTTVTGGTLGITNADALGSGTVALENGTTLVLDGTGIDLANDVTVAGDPTVFVDTGNADTISGTISDGATAGDLVKTGGGTLTLSGTNTYSGGTTISGGTLQVTNDDSVGTGKVTLDGGTFQAGAASLAFTNDFAVNTTGGTVDTNGGNTVTLGGISDGDGAGGTLTILNSGSSTGIVKIGAASDYSGATTVGDGTGRVVLEAEGAADVLSANSAVTVKANSYLNTGGYDQTIGSLAGDGTVQGAGGVAQTLTTGGDDSSTTFSGVIDNGGGTLALVKEGTGTFTLSGTNTYTGGTTVSGGTLAITNANALGSGDLALEDGTTLTLDGTGIDLANDITVAGDPTIFVDTGNADTISGTISDGATAGDIVKTGGGSLTLSGTNTYTGGTTVSGGTLAAGSSSAFGTGSVAVASGATLDINGQDLTIGSLSDVSGSGGTVTNDGAAVGSLTTGGDDSSTTFSGTIEDGAKALALVKEGTGSLTLSGNNTYTGGTTVSAGTLAAGSSSAFGTGSVAVASGATLDINGQDLTIGSLSDVSGAGGTVTNDGAADGSLTTGGDDSSTTFSGTIGDGAKALALVKEGTGTFTLSGTNTYTGGTTVSGGTLAITNANALGSGDLALEDGTTLTLDGTGIDLANDVTVAGDPTIFVDTGNADTISGTISDGATAGDIVKTGGGTLTLSGTNTYTGGTTVSGGTLAITNANALGSGNLALEDGTTLSLDGTGIDLGNDVTVAGDPTIFVDTGNADTISGTISDGATAGDLVKTGDGTLILSGTNTYTGGTTVNAGTLNVTGSIASSSLTTVNTGATLVGTGTVGDLKISSGGTFAPGAAGVPGGKTTVSGTLTLDTGSTYLVALDPSTASYADVTGTASLSGTALAAFAPGTYVTRQYTILQSAGLGGTTFDALSTTDLPSPFVAKLEYTSTDVLLDLTAILGEGDTLDRNQRQVADGINNYFNGGGALPPNFLTLFGLSGGNLANALSGLSGEVATGGAHGSFRLMSGFLGLFSGAPAAGGTELSFAPEPALPAAALAYAPTAEAPAAGGQWKLWGAGFGGTSRVDGDPAAGSHKVNANDYGFALGADYDLSPETVLGFAVAGGSTEWDLAQSLGGGDSDALQLGLHATTRFGPAYLSAALGFANHWMTTNRYAYGDRLTSDFTAQSYAGRIEAGYRVAAGPALGLTPYAALQVQHFRSPGHSETDLGGGGYALSYDAMSVTDTRSELGARIDHATTLGGDRLVLKAGAAWAHDHATDPSATAGFQALPGSSFTVSGARTPENAALISAGAELQVASNVSLSASFDGEGASGYRSYAGTATLRVSW